MPRSTAPPFPSGLIDGSKEISGDSRLSSLSTTYVVFVVDVATSLSCEVRLNYMFLSKPCSLALPLDSLLRTEDPR